MHYSGNTLNDNMSKREKNDEITEDPFSLPPAKGLHSYWAATNSWSLDGLPGVRSIAQMVRNDRVDETLSKSGLTREYIFEGRRRKEPELLAGVTAGIVIGFSLAALLQAAVSRSVLSNLGTTASRLFSS